MIQNISTHTSCITYVVTNVVSNSCRVSWIVFWNTSFNFTNKVSTNVLMMAIATLISRLLGLVRELSIAMIFGSNGSNRRFLGSLSNPEHAERPFCRRKFQQRFCPRPHRSQSKGEWRRSKAILVRLFFFLLSLE